MPEPKLRAACDQCSATKTKCSGDHPKCTRCQANGRDCHYSKSMRAGKPPRSRQLLNRRASSLQNVLQQHPSRSLHSPATTTANTPILPNPSPPTPSRQTSRRPSPYSKIAPHEHLYPAVTAEGHSLPRIGMASDGFPASDGSMLGAFGMLHTPRSHDEPFDFGHSKPYFEPYCVPVSPLDLSRSEALSGSPPAMTVADDCFRLATDTLKSLYTIQRLVEGHNCEGSPGIDQVLQICCMAITNTERLLACACRKDFYLPLLIGMLLSKVLAWYQAVINLRDPHTELPDGRFQARESVADDTLAFGAYPPDDETRWVMRHQLVLRQLQRLSEVVSQYHATFGIVDSGKSTGEGGRLYRVLDSFLRTKMQYTIRVVESRLGSAS
ncbi:Aflatoxin biosynthesis regulatory protein [Teratosphaeria destructans]|uniref:Aflatoxin biosynthesis regulatory protein n=1 Tax=Teratosphaeria destructans TaxID=418781 RepID=A0A9W7SRD3_9PEZI|nr:Aflatoxin biosynthesis regulatory protein [Teratosphaeria destructans]